MLVTGFLSISTQDAQRINTFTHYLNSNQEFCLSFFFFVVALNKNDFLTSRVLSSFSERGVRTPSKWHRVGGSRRELNQTPSPRKARGGGPVDPGPGADTTRPSGRPVLRAASLASAGQRIEKKPHVHEKLEAHFFKKVCNLKAPDSLPPEGSGFR